MMARNESVEGKETSVAQANDRKSFPFIYAKTNRYFAQYAEGFEEIAASELTRLGAREIQPAFRGCHFTADKETLYRVVYQSRLLSRVLAPLAEFRCRDRDDLYRAGRAIDWSAIFSPAQTFGIFANVSGNANLTHSKFAALCLKDAVADAFRAATGKRPDVDRLDPDVTLNLFIERERATVSIDASGGAMHRRGYRRETVTAPMPETLAAAMVALSGWDGEKSLHDPFCGSGTLLCEALMAWCRIPAGFLRNGFGVRLLPDFEEKIWNRMKQSADKAIRDLRPGLITGSDVDPAAIKATRINAPLLPGGDAIRIRRNDFRRIDSLENRVILCNPPYGIRLEKKTDLPAFYKDFGSFLKQKCKGSEAYIYFGNREMIKRIGLKPSWKKPVRNAGLDGRVVKYEMY